jgi:uncharacterized RDD family membrane protein YckC
MEYEDRLTIATPEGVELQLTLAGIGSRMIAASVDLTLQVISYVILLLLLQNSDIGAAVLAVAAFLLVFGYDVSFEVLAGGRTPGKRFTGLRVVRSGGRPVDLVTSAIRNFLRAIDFLPALYGIGMLSVLATSRNQRLGDLAAGTLVVRERLGGRASPAELLQVPEGAAIQTALWDVSAVGPDDIATVRAFLERRPELEPGARGALASDLAARLRGRVAGAPADLPPESFLELLAAAKAARG